MHISHFILLLFLLLTACQSQRDNALYMPHLGGDEAIVAQTPLVELRQLKLISTNLVSALVQIPEMKVGTTTLQISEPTSAFGNTLIQALENVGFGLQRVSADQGLNYVTYGKRISDTEAGIITDYSVVVGEVEVRREYEVTGKDIFPSSLLFVSGTRSIVDIELDDRIFTEQGGTGDSFISGIGSISIDAPSTNVSTVSVNDYDAKPISTRTSQRGFLRNARQQIYARESTANPVRLESYSQLRRAVLIFNDKNTFLMGRGNKQAIRLLARDYTDGDVFSITACTDADGKNDVSQIRGVRVEEEFVSHGIDASAVQIEPCIRASYRHSSDNSPVAVSVVQFRTR